MRSVTVRRYGLAAAVVLMTALGVDAQPEAEWAAVEQAIGAKGAVQAGGGFRVGMPRSDLNVTGQGVAVRPGFALGSYATFRKTRPRAVLIGDLVLLDEGVPKV